MLPSSSTTTYPMQSSIGSPPYNDANSDAYSNSTPRVALPTNFQATNAHLSSQYVPNSNRHGMPFHMPQAPNAGIPASSAFAPQWNTVSPNGRQMASNLAFDPNLQSSYQPSAYTYMPSSGASYGTSVSEVSTGFPGLSPLASHLPYNSNNRTLPNPASIPSTLPNSNSPLQENEGSLGFYPGQLDKFNGGWDLSSGTSRGSVSSAAQDPISASELASNTSSSSPTLTPDGSSIGYGHPSRLSQVESDGSISALHPRNFPARMNDNDDYTSIAPNLQPNRAGSNDFSNLGPTYNLQSVHGNFGLQDNSMELMNPQSSTISSQLPTSILHSQPRYSTTLGASSAPRKSPEASSQGRKPSHNKVKGLRSHGMR